jgi:hypothetical protein
VNNFFDEATRLRNGKVLNALTPYRTFAISSTAYHLNYHPNIRRLSVCEVAKDYCLPDLCPSLADYVDRIRQGAPQHNMTGHRIALSGCKLPFDELQVWNQLRMQSKSYHDASIVLPAQVVLASPSSNVGEFGKFDTVLVNIDPSKAWPYSGLNGELYLWHDLRMAKADSF